MTLRLSSTPAGSQNQKRDYQAFMVTTTGILHQQPAEVGNNNLAYTRILIYAFMMTSKLMFQFISSSYQLYTLSQAPEAGIVFIRDGVLLYLDQGKLQFCCWFMRTMHFSTNVTLVPYYISRLGPTWCLSFLLK